MGGGAYRRGNYIHISTHGDNNCEAVFGPESWVCFHQKCFVISCLFLAEIMNA